MASFQAKIGWKRQRKGENKNCSSVSFPPDAKQKIQKKQKNIQKIKKYNYGFVSSQNTVEKIEKERKQKLTSYFVPAHREIENSKNIAKNLKN